MTFITYWKNSIYKRMKLDYCFSRCSIILPFSEINRSLSDVIDPNLLDVNFNEFKKTI